jgi:hypothetical protein
MLQTSWGSRPDGDINDNERMIPRVLPAAEVMINPAAYHEGLIRYRDEKRLLKKEEMDLHDTGCEKTIQNSLRVALH